MRLHLGAFLLERELDRYRQENQGPLLRRAGDLFPRLTLGQYSALRVELGAKDEEELRCVRAEGSKVAIPALSDGTRDQLYLALRLASLERYAEVNEPLPLILDDVLIHFDDDRARAALEVLGEMSNRLQILFFTHHARLAELARETVSPRNLCDRELAAPR
jgi:uncharacterized protein YhaN